MSAYERREILGLTIQELGMVSLREFHLLGNRMDKLKLSKVDKNIPADNTCAKALHQEGASCLSPLEASLSLISMVVAFRLSGTLIVSSCKSITLRNSSTESF